jgi:hypothetical protein
MKRKVGLLMVAILSIGLVAFPAITTGGALERPESWDGLDRSHSTVYKMYRPGLRVRLEVRGNKIIVPIYVWALRKCSNGFEGGSGLFLEEAGQGIPIRPDGRFERKHFLAGESRLNRLSGRVRRRTIRGFYLQRNKEGPSGPLCGTGQPGDRALHFVARRK